MSISFKQELLLFILRSEFGFLSTKQINNEFEGQYSKISIKKGISDLVDTRTLEHIGIKKGIYRITSKKLNFQDFLYLGCLLNDNGVLSFDTVNSFLGTYENEKKIIKIALETGKNSNNVKGYYYKGYVYSFYSLKKSLFNVRYKEYKGIRYFENEKAFLDEIYISFMNGFSKKQFDLKKFYLSKFDKERLFLYLNELDYTNSVRKFIIEKVVKAIDSDDYILGGLRLSDFEFEDNEENGLVV